MMGESRVTLKTDIEELVKEFPESVKFLTSREVRCIKCGEPFWGSIGDLLEEEEIDDPQGLVEELNQYIKEKNS
ncbi:DUF1858 domain-containing protein [bacterium]|nr:DUF1858 domain-containing protein [bacterium]